MKKLIALLLTAIMVFGLVACASNTDSSKTNDTTTSTDTQAPADTETKADDAADEQPAADDQASDAAADDGENIIIAATVPMTGEPIVSYATIQGLELAAKEINEAGGVLGKQLEIVWEDMGTTADVALNAVNKIIARGDVNVHVGINYSSSALAVEAAVKEAKLPTITGGTSPLLADIDNPYVFRGRTGDKYMINVAMSYLQDSLGIQEGSTIALLYNNNDFGIGALNVLTELCDAANIKLVSEAYNVDDSDITSQYLKLKQASPDAIIVWSSVNGFPVASRAIYEQGADCPVMASSSASMQAVIDTCDPWMNGWYSLADACMDNPDPEMQAFVKNYTDAYGTETLNFAAAYAYSWAYVIKDAYERAGTTENEAFVKALNETSGVKGLNGTYTRFAEIEMLNCASVGKIEDGSFVFDKVVDNNAQ